MQPITYSLILNLTVLAITGFLSWHTGNPLLVIIAIILQTHALQKFNENDDDDDDDNDEESRPVGFTADIK